MALSGRDEAASEKSSLEEADDLGELEDVCDPGSPLVSLADAATTWLPALRPLSRHVGLTGNLNLMIGTTSVSSPSRRSQLASVQGADIASMLRAANAGEQLRGPNPSCAASLLSYRANSVAESRATGVSHMSHMAKSSSDSALLQGVSPPVMLQNARARRCMLTSSSAEEMRRISRGPSDLRAVTFQAPDEQGFTTMNEALARTISELRDDHEAFDPRKGGRRRSLSSFGRLLPRGGVQPAQNQVNAERSAERHERLAERLEAYKMARRIEPELPPLTKEPSFRRLRPEQGIVLRNTCREALEQFLPDMRKGQLMRRREERIQHQHVVAHQRESQLLEAKERNAEVVARKQMKAAAILSFRRNPNRKQSRRFALDRWLIICCVVSWLRNVKEDVELYRMDMVARINYVENHVMKSRRSSSVVMQQAVFFGQIMMHDTLIRALRVFISVVKAKQRIMEARKNARMVHGALHHWKVAGPFFLGVKRLAWQIRKLQGWWRSCIRRLHGLRDGISKRWEKIERKEVFNDLAKERSMKVRGPKKITEAEMQQELIPEAARINFIENELRARRYRMLPEILLCEEDTRKFKLQTQSLLETRNCYIAMGLKPPDECPQYVGMDRPSYLPPVHLPSEACGGCCPEWCLGRKGDEEIFAMVRAARSSKNGEGWTRIPQRRNSTIQHRRTQASAQKTAASSRGLEQRRGEKSSSEQASPFGEVVEDEELRKWGAGPEEMPLMRNGA